MRPARPNANWTNSERHRPYPAQAATRDRRMHNPPVTTAASGRKRSSALVDHSQAPRSHSAAKVSGRTQLRACTEAALELPRDAPTTAGATWKALMSRKNSTSSSATCASPNSRRARLRAGLPGWSGAGTPHPHDRAVPARAERAPPSRRAVSIVYCLRRDRF